MPERTPPQSIDDAQRELERLRREIDQFRQESERPGEDKARQDALDIGDRAVRGEISGR